MNITTEININWEFEKKIITVKDLVGAISQAKMFIWFSKSRDDIKKWIYWQHILDKLLKL